MKSTGIVRKIDPLGRIVIPKELRRMMDLKKADPMEIFVEEDVILLKKYNSKGSCMITGEVLDENKEFAPGLILSPKGAEILLETLQKEK